MDPNIYGVLNSRETLCLHVLFVSSNLEILGLFRLRQCFLVCLDKEILLHNKAPVFEWCVCVAHSCFYVFFLKTSDVAKCVWGNVLQIQITYHGRHVRCTFSHLFRRLVKEEILSERG